MATTIRVEETFDSRKLSKDREERSYVIFDTLQNSLVSETQAKEEWFRQIPDRVSDWPRGDWSLERLGGNSFIGSITYAKDAANDEQPEQEEGQDVYTVSFDGTGGQEKLYQAIETVGRYAQGNPVLDEGAINYDGKKVEGVEIIVPKLSFRIQATLPAQLVTFAYVRDLFNLTGTMNQAPFLGFERGEVLFEGPSGQLRIPATNSAEVTLNFGASPNLKNLVLGDSASNQITVGEKLGWDYLEVQYKDDEGGNRIVKVPRQANVRRVYKFGDFEKLRAGNNVNNIGVL